MQQARSNLLTTNVDTVEIADGAHMFIRYQHEEFGDALAAFVGELDASEVASKQ